MNTVPPRNIQNLLQFKKKTEINPPDSLPSQISTSPSSIPPSPSCTSPACPAPNSPRCRSPSTKPSPPPGTACPHPPTPTRPPPRISSREASLTVSIILTVGGFVLSAVECRLRLTGLWWGLLGLVRGRPGRTRRLRRPGWRPLGSGRGGGRGRSCRGVEGMGWDGRECVVALGFGWMRCDLCTGCKIHVWFVHELGAHHECFLFFFFSSNELESPMSWKCEYE